ncbi:MAG: 50S ribosomal protein L25, partial [Vallitaleaceae bacterium]|nr:50S ribosomal protein L25 [Vallitaleaceae bacterium]
MEEIILEAIERNVKTARLENEFVAGVLYGDSIVKATSVMFNRIALRKVLSVHGANAKVWIKYNESKKYGYIKEVQRHAVTRDISHIDVQIVSKDHEIKMAIPITYLGEEELKSRQLQLQVYKSSISV